MKITKLLALIFSLQNDRTCLLRQLKVCMVKALPTCFYDKLLSKGVTIQQLLLKTQLMLTKSPGDGGDLSIIV